eukprot:CAMPEP_0195507858 /NCGR_PEP_ID=MMETSP0794_2-20130614/1222_1 /TAXON_ID=515487 /ORGANISM="Stephanopyxis turris, Strain CCMP 815" /LENGTH=354 /DNA_ID=CAMNT_0040634675 /DNA_START=152 /DNA_END=1216 /DNA_ORIENTATION=+
MDIDPKDIETSSIGSATETSTLVIESNTVDSVSPKVSSATASANTNIAESTSAIKETPDTTLTPTDTQTASVETLQKMAETLRQQLSSTNEELQQQKSTAMSEKSKRLVIEEEWKQDLERMARLNAESDQLTEVIARMQAENAALSNAVGEAQLATQSSNPLKYENIRIKAEMGTVNANSRYLQAELTKKAVELETLESKYQSEIAVLKTHLVPLQQELQSMKNILEHNQSHIAAMEKEKSQLESKLSVTNEQLGESQKNFKELMKRCEGRLAAEQQATEAIKMQNQILQSQVKTLNLDIKALEEAAAQNEVERMNKVYNMERNDRAGVDVRNVRDGYRDVYGRWRQDLNRPSN